MYTVFKKNSATFIFAISLVSVDQFDNFFIITIRNDRAVVVMVKMYMGMSSREWEGLGTIRVVTAHSGAWHMYVNIFPEVVTKQVVTSVAGSRAHIATALQF